jgi:hypothetical protein
MASTRGEAITIVTRCEHGLGARGERNAELSGAFVTRARRLGSHIGAGSESALPMLGAAQAEPAPSHKQKHASS